MRKLDSFLDPGCIFILFISLLTLDCYFLLVNRGTIAYILTDLTLKFGAWLAIGTNIGYEHFEIMGMHGCLKIVLLLLLHGGQTYVDCVGYDMHTVSLKMFNMLFDQITLMIRSGFLVTN